MAAKYWVKYHQIGGRIQIKTKRRRRYQLSKIFQKLGDSAAESTKTNQLGGGQNQLKILGIFPNISSKLAAESTVKTNWAADIGRSANRERSADGCGNLKYSGNVPEYSTNWRRRTTSKYSQIRG
jgi:hypothetical protein